MDGNVSRNVNRNVNRKKNHKQPDYPERKRGLFRGWRRKRILLSLVLTVLMLFSTAGCRSEKSKDSVLNGPCANVTFSWWGNDERHIYTMEGIQTFMKEHPDIHVDMSYGAWAGYETKMRVLMKSHTEADVMQINYDWLDEYSPDGKGFYDLNDLKDEIDLSAYDEEELSFGIIHGHLNAVPTAFNTLTVYYDKDVFDEYGLDLPETWADLFTAGKKMKEDDRYVLGLSEKQVFLLLLTYFEQSEGIPFFRQDGTLNADAGQVANLFRFYRECIREHVLKPIDAYSRSDYQSGNVAGTVAWVSNAGDYIDELAKNGKTAVIGEYLRIHPEDPLTGWYIKPATMYAISSRTAYPEAAAKLLNYLVNSPEMAELQKTEKGVPASSRALDTLKQKGELDTSEYKASQKMESERSSMQTFIPVMEDDDVISSFKECTDVYIYDEGNLTDNVSKFISDIRS